MYKFPVVNRQKYIMYLELFNNLYWLHTDVFKWSAETKKHYIKDLNQLQSLLNAPICEVLGSVVFFYQLFNNWINPEWDALQRTSMAQNELMSIIQAEIDDAIGFIESETVEQRKQALEAYLRQPYGNEVEGKSQIVTGEVAEAIDGALPSLVRIFTGCEMSAFAMLFVNPR